ncbi:MAG: hypothetical protein FWH29_10940 [Methanobrevibacter sp.]|nr:hypothetical protein [Methanobrevibacter sp.]
MNNTTPNNQKTKFCIYCGKEIPVNAKKCSYCFQWLDDEISSENSYSNVNNSVDKFTENETRPGNVIGNQNYNRNRRVNTGLFTEEYSKIIPIRRFYLLMALTLGLYGIYWFYKNSSYLRDEFGKDISVGLRTLAFAIIPIASTFVFYELINDMKKLMEEKGLETYSPGLNALILLFFPCLGMWVFINVQESLNDFWKVREPQLPVRREFDNAEIIAMIFTPLILPVLLFLFLFFFYLLNLPYYY